LGIEAGPRVFSFFWRNLRPFESVVHRWKNPTQTFTAAFDLLNPALGRVRPRQPPPETPDVEIDGFSEGVSIYGAGSR